MVGLSDQSFPSVKFKEKARRNDAQEARDAQVSVRGVLQPGRRPGLIKDGGSKRRAAVETLVKGLGGRLEAFYFAYGEADAP